MTRLLVELWKLKVVFKAQKKMRNVLLETEGKKIMIMGTERLVELCL